MSLCLKLRILCTVGAFSASVQPVLAQDVVPVSPPEAVIVDALPPDRVLAPTLSEATIQAPKHVTLRFEGGLLEDNIGATLEKLYLRHLLPTSVVNAAGSTSLTEVMRKYRSWPGGTISPRLEMNLCAANPQSCKLEKTRAVWNFPRGNAQVLVEDQGCGAVLPVGWICVPDVQVSEYKTIQSLSYSPKTESLEQIILQRARGCESLDNDCLDVLRFLNRNDLSGAAGWLRMPVKSFSMRVPIRSREHEASIMQAVGDTRATQRDMGKLSSKNANMFITRSQNYKAEAAIKLPAGVDVNDPKRMMNFPVGSAALTELMKLPEEYIGVFDRRADARHCVLYPVAPPGAATEKVIIRETYGEDDDGIPKPPARDEECTRVFSQSRSSLEVYDHATHIIGILAGQPLDKKLGNDLTGINPSARIWVYEVGVRRHKGNDDPIGSVALEKPSFSPHVINISQTMEGVDSRDYMRRIIFGADENGNGWAGVMVFVMAAGKPRTPDKARVDQSTACDVYPACWALTETRRDYGLLTVVGLSADGSTVLRDSAGNPLSRFGQAFDVAAVGEAWSAYFGNAFGPMQGSSVATPYVAGLASLLYAQVRLQSRGKITPDTPDVANRIRYTADLTDALNETVRFGRINAARALAFDTDKISVNGPEETEEHMPGTVVRTTDVVIVSEAAEADLGTGTMLARRDLKIPVSAIKRISRKAKTSAYWLIYQEDGALKRLNDATFDETQQLRVRAGRGLPGERISTVKLNSIREYVACSFTCKQ
ncbi:MAG: S8 family serine peptidase [Massilia sp.]|uniref:S8 family serine peptidase n=1 Tax=Massilia sp. TaxID=1882437 RepID=UPI002FCC2416